jgi:hypothetical protein
MPIWEWILVFILILKLILIVITLISPPKVVKDWLASHFEIHSKLSEAKVTVTMDEKALTGEDKKQMIDYFNQATFLKKYDVPPIKGEGTPLIIDNRQGKKHIRYFLYIYSDRVDVFKEYKNKVMAYYLSSDNLPEHLTSEEQKVTVL